MYEDAISIDKLSQFNKSEYEDCVEKFDKKFANLKNNSCEDLLKTMPGEVKNNSPNQNKSERFDNTAEKSVDSKDKKSIKNEKPKSKIYKLF